MNSIKSLSRLNEKNVPNNNNKTYRSLITGHNHGIVLLEKGRDTKPTAIAKEIKLKNSRKNSELIRFIIFSLIMLVELMITA